jgi:hypothetical protein
MSVQQLPINQDTYSTKLHAALWNLQSDKDLDMQTIRLLLSIIQINLVDIDLDQLKEKFQNGLLEEIVAMDISAITSNMELIARVNEIKILYKSSYIRGLLKETVIRYWQLFDITKQSPYLIRALALIKLGKQMFKQELPGFFETAVKIVIDLPYLIWQFHLIEKMPSAFGAVPVRNSLQDYLEEKLQTLLDNGDLDGARIVSDCLNIIGVINDHQNAIRKAVLYEEEGDLTVANRSPNTFYPSISQKYTAALDLLREVPDCQEVRSRIIAKLELAQHDDIKMVAAAGIKTGPNIDVQHLISRIAAVEINSFSDAMQALLSIQIPILSPLKKDVDLDAEPSFLDRAFSKHVRLSSQGKPVGFKEGENAKDNQLRMLLREHIIMLIKMFKDVMDIHGTLSNQQVFEILLRLESPFIPPDRASVYAMGLGAGFRGNFVEAAHLLIPQLENSFRYLATREGISVTNFKEKEQLENTLGGTLQKITAITTPDLLEELQGFLIDGSDINFRNELLHGILQPKLVEHYGYYAWWLSLKLIYQTKLFFKIS